MYLDRHETQTGGFNANHDSVVVKIDESRYFQRNWMFLYAAQPSDKSQGVCGKVYLVQGLLHPDLVLLPEKNVLILSIPPND